MKPVVYGPSSGNTCCLSHADECFPLASSSCSTTYTVNSEVTQITMLLEPGDRAESN